jgi:NAD(P)-dependent dehydrogenase (short-subunit alcohol dehydrogenase family)
MHKKSVLITGTSTGIGRACALHLAQLGFKVFAGVRKPEDGDDLVNKSEGIIQPVILDVTKKESIKETSELIKSELEYPLYGLVNNAGIGMTGVVEAIPVDMVRKMFEVNIIGMFLVTRALLPLLRQNKGRIVNIGSSAGIMSTSGHSTYSATKFAVRGFTDGLRMELEHFGMFISLVSPGSIESAMWEKNLAYKQEMRKNIDPELQEIYKMFIVAGDRAEKRVKPISADHVVRVVEHALTAKKPKCEYVVGKDARIIKFLSRWPKRMVNKIFIDHMKKALKNADFGLRNAE